MSEWSTAIRRILTPLFAAGIAGVSSWLLIPKNPVVIAVLAIVGAVLGLIATYLLERLKYEAEIIRAKAEYTIAKAQAKALTSAVDAGTGKPRKKKSTPKDVRADGFKVLKQLGDDHLQLARILHERGPDTNTPDPGGESAPPAEPCTEPTDIASTAETPPGPRRLESPGDEEPAAS